MINIFLINLVLLVDQFVLLLIIGKNWRMPVCRPRPFPTASPQDAQSKIPRPTMRQSHLIMFKFFCAKVILLTLARSLARSLKKYTPSPSIIPHLQINVIQNASLVKSVFPITSLCWYQSQLPHLINMTYS